MKLKEEVLKFCLSSNYYDSMGLFKVVVVRQLIGKHTYGSLDIELNDKFYLNVTPLHSFYVIRDGEEICVRADELHDGDKIWIDIKSFTTSGLLYRL